jgi:mannose-6-phosphate isomerase-like protein (cupin superfamily)
MTTSIDATTLVLAPGEGEPIEVAGNRIRVLAAAPRLTVIDYTAPPGFPGPPLHVHTAFDEFFLVLEGRLEMRVRDDVHEIGPGGSAFVEGDVPHTFANPTAEPVRFLAVCAPGGFEDYLRALAAGDQPGVAAASARAGYAPRPSD